MYWLKFFRGSLGFMILKKFYQIPLLIALLHITQLPFAQKFSVKDSVEKLHKQIKTIAPLNPDEALLLSEKALALCQENNLSREQLQSYYSFGLAYYYKNFYSTSNEYYQKITLAPESEQEQLSAAWNNMGINYEMLGMLDSSLYAYLSSQKIDIQRKDKKSEHMSLINIGLLNGKLGRFDTAFSQLNQAKTYFGQENDLDNLALCHMNLGYIYSELNMGDSAIENYKRAERIYLITEDIPNLYYIYLNQTSFWVDALNEKMAKSTFQKAANLLPKLDMPFYKATQNSFASLLHSGFGRRDSAIYYSLKALAGYDSLGVREKVRSEYYGLIKLYAETGRMKELDMALIAYDTLTKALVNEDINQRVAEQEVKHKLDLKNLQLQNIEKELQARRVRIVLTLTLSAVLFLALLYVFRLYRKVERAHRTLYNKSIEQLKQEEQRNKKDISPIPVEENALLAKFTRLLTEDEFYKRSDLSLKMAAQELGTNEKYLSQAINTTGDNFNTYVNRFRVNEAKRIILESKHNDMSIEELGMMTGFSNRHTFSRSFAQITGISPSEFRRIHLSESE